MNKLSLRVRLILSIALVLVISLMFGGLLVYWHAVQKVDEEMGAALEVGIRTIQNATDDIEELADPLRQLQLLVEDFNGNRHLHVSFISNEKAVIAMSHPLEPKEPAPAWFNHFLARPPETARIILPPSFARYGSLLLETDSHNEIDEVWSDVLVTLAILTVFFILVLGLVCWAIGRSISILNNMAVALARVGAGDYSPRCEEKGASELAALSRCFNEMAARLSVMEIQNRSLEEQLTTMQEEERADIARDLHDEIGPLLFGMSIDISAMQKLDSIEQSPKITAHLTTMSSAISDMQQHVRSMLGKLRPAVLLDLGLNSAVDNLIAFWNMRHPDVNIDVDLSWDSFGEALDGTIYRIFQEGLNNAFRHGRPSLIKIKAIVVEDNVEIELSDDGQGLNPANRGFGFGITGMNDRVSAAGGTFKISNRLDGSGVSIFAKLPLDVMSKEQVS